MGDWRESARERVKEKSQGNTISLQEGTNVLRVLPHKKDITPEGRLKNNQVSAPPYVEFRIHRNVGPDKSFLRCGKDIVGRGSCWFCDKLIPALVASGKARQAEEIESQDQFLVIATRFDPETQKFSIPKPWWISTGGGRSLSVRVQAKLASSKKDYLDPIKGYNLNIERVGTGLKTRYPSVEGDDSPSKVPAAVLQAVRALEEVMPKYDAEEQKAAYYGRPRRDEEEEEEKPRRSKVEEEPEESEAEEELEEAADEEAAEEEEPEEAQVEEEEPEEEEAEEEPEEAEEEEEEPEEEELEEEEPPPPPRRPAKPLPPTKSKSSKPSAKPQPPAKPPAKRR